MKVASHGREQPFDLMDVMRAGRARSVKDGPAARRAAAARSAVLELRSDGALFAPYAAATGRRRDETGPPGDRLAMR